MFGLKDKLIRRLARSFALKYLDGYKTDIMRAVALVNDFLIISYLACPYLPEISGVLACAKVDELNAKWLALGVLLSRLGLEFGIQDAKAKQRLAKAEEVK